LQGFAPTTLFEELLLTRSLRPCPVSAARAALLLALAATGPLAAAVAPVRHLTAPSTAPALEIATGFLQGHAERFGVAAADLAEAAATDAVRSAHNGATHLYFRQRVNGLEVDGAELAVHVDRAGRVFHATGRPVAGLAERAAATRAFPLLSPEEAVAAAARALGLDDRAELELLEAPAGIDRRSRFASPAISEGPIPVRLRYHRERGGDRLTLVWNLSVEDPRTPDWWELWIDAESGAPVDRINWTADSSYEAFALPKESPLDGARSVEVDPHLDGGIASLFGWHDTNGVAGAEFTVTSGNNVTACVDADADNDCDGGSLPDGGAGLDFTGALVPLDLDVDEPADYRPAAVVNLFYWNNVIHDVLYQYGFDEAAGNFQENNYGRGGSGSDSVDADAQDGSGTNNANFSTPPDGLNPRMQMYRWTAPESVEVHAPAPVAGPQVAGTADFGPGSYLVAGRDVVLVDDGSGSADDDGCCNDSNTITGVSPAPIALLRRGICNFSIKAYNAQLAGAAGVVLTTRSSAWRPERRRAR